MGLSWSNSNSNNNNRRRGNYYQTPQFFSSPPPYPYSPDPYSVPLSYPYSAALPPPANPIYSSHYYPTGYNACNYHNPVMGRAHFGGPAHYYGYQSDGWVAGAPPSVAYVEHQEAKRVKSDVNVHKDTVKIEVDEAFPDRHLVSFVFDALCDGSITIFYFAKEEPSCKVIPVFPRSCIPVKIPFQKGLGQKFRQPSGTGINFNFFNSDDISKPSAEDVFPLVISAETCFPSLMMDGYLSYPSANTSPHTQITQAVLEKNNDDPMKVRVIKQILWIDEIRYELREIYGIGNSAQAVSENDCGKDCVICMTEPKDTAVLPCRHMCMCSECAKELRLQSNKCPICRQSIEELMEIKINYIDQ